jgi:hypothetical protein
MNVDPVVFGAAPVIIISGEDSQASEDEEIEVVGKDVNVIYKCPFLKEWWVYTTVPEDLKAHEVIGALYNLTSKIKLWNV